MCMKIDYKYDSNAKNLFSDTSFYRDEETCGKKRKQSS